MRNIKIVQNYSVLIMIIMYILNVAPRTNAMKVVGVDNLFCADEKAGLFVGHTEAICPGSLASHNAVRLVMGLPLLILPSSIAIGDIIAFDNEKAATREGRTDRYTFAGASYFKRIHGLSIYTTYIEEIGKRVNKIDLDNIFEQKLV